MIGNDLGNRRVEVRAPGTCGEWIQTVRLGRECLVSLPIDRYVTMRLTLGGRGEARDSQAALMPKSRAALDKICQHLDLEKDVASRIALSRHSQLLVGKGMASSTADMLCVMAGVAHLASCPLSPETLFKLCCEIEASDGIMFESWSLVDHLRGERLQSHQPFEGMEVLMLTPERICVTDKLRNGAGYREKLAEKSSEPLRLFEEAMSSRSKDLLGEAATASLLENEAILKKPHLDQLIAFAQRHHCHGIAGGHSGTVVGLLVSEERTDKEALLYEWERSALSAYYKKTDWVRTVVGGCELVNLED